MRRIALDVKLLYTAAACLVAAQLIGIYGLVTRKADVIFAVLMLGFLVAAGVLGVYGAYHRIT